MDREQVATTDFEPPEIVVHSANVSARAKMEAGIRSIASIDRSIQCDQVLLDLRSALSQVHDLRYRSTAVHQ